MLHVSTDQKAMPVQFTILVVGDEVVIRALVTQFLRDEGFTVIEACKTDEVMAILATKVPDLIITDIRVPGAGDGIALAQRVREMNFNVPIIITSTQLAERTDLASDRTHFLSKPYCFDALIELIERELTNG